MRTNSSLGFVKISNKAITNNVHIRQQFVWVRAEVNILMYIF